VDNVMLAKNGQA